MTLTNWQGSFNGLTFGGVGANIGIVSVKGWEDLPDIRSGDEPYSRGPGALAGLDLPGERVVELELEITPPAGSTLPQWVDVCKSAFMPQKSLLLPLTMQLPGQVSKLSNCRVRKRSTPIDISYAAGITTMSLQFVAPDPLLYDATPKSKTTTLPSPSSGAAFNVTFPMTFGGTVGGGGTMLCANFGGYATQGIATITGPCTNPRVQNSSTNETVAVNLTLGATDVLVIDFAAHTVILNTNGYRYGSITQNEWWSLEANAMTTVAFYSSDPSPTGATLTYTWSDAWL